MSSKEPLLGAKSNIFALASLYALYVSALLSTYIVQLAEAHKDKGWRPLDMSAESWLGMAIGLAFCIWTFSRMDGRPSDFFRFFLCALPLTSFILLHSGSESLPRGAVLACILMLIAPLILMEIFNGVFPPLTSPKRSNPVAIEWMVSLPLVFAILIGFLSAPENAGFGLNNSHIRRFEGRELYAAGSLQAYVLSMSMNGFIPYLAFLSALKKNVWLLGLAILAGIFFFWLIGVKAPLAYLIVAHILGWLLRWKMLNKVAHIFLSAIVVLWMIVLLEWWLKGYSYTADYLFRRLFPVQAFQQGYYLDFLLSEKLISWSWLTGASDPNFQASFYIGERYDGGVKTNSNTNAFLSAFMSAGVVGYAGAAIFISSILVVFDRLWRSSRNPSYLFLGFLYGILVIEQAYTVAMVSSGVGLLFMLVFFEKPVTHDNSSYVN
ncbi:hypothetical protein [Polaromonas eurypsychrophila]|uniref:hypothetical protein n=1 Tax=Polaromonas eurypsychrophila TaxID=1614635 RepID=UPI00166B7047|nr:hypothetical protein [Polaromonas eurypsychrophila]